MHQIAIDKANNGFCHLRLRRKRIAEPYLNIFVVTEATGNSKEDGTNGNNGQQSGIGQSRSLSHHPFCRKETDRQQNLFQHIDKKIAQRRYITLRYPPNADSEKLNNPLHLFYIKKHCSYKPGSVTLFPERRLPFI